jgi:hypothetical protein
MSYDKYSIEYYLTLDGWKTNKEELAPGSILEIWEKETYQGSGFGRESSTAHKRWTDPALSKEQSRLLRGRFPFPERPKITDDLFKNMMPG